MFEIWASDSGNRLLATSDWNEVRAWVTDYWSREGDDALDALSAGDDDAQWVARARQILEYRLNIQEQSGRRRTDG